MSSHIRGHLVGHICKLTDARRINHDGITSSTLLVPAVAGTVIDYFIHSGRNQQKIFLAASAIAAGGRDNSKDSEV
jgi:hypothetical protein